MLCSTIDRKRLRASQKVMHEMEMSARVWICTFSKITNQQRLTTMSVFLSNVDDFVNPSQACVNPVFNGAAASTTSPQGRGEEGAVAVAGVRTRGPGQKKRTATITTDQVVTATIADCLACSGCVTTAETVLMEERHNLEKLSTALALKRPVLLTISPAALADWQRHHDHGNGTGIASTAQWVSLWHKYLNVVAVIDGNLPLQWSLAAAVREFTDAYRRNQKRLLATAAEKNGKYLDINVSKNEMFERKMMPSRALDRNKTEYWLADGTTEVVDEAPQPRTHQALPLITSSCPAIVCYVEKSSHALVPHLSTAASPMMCVGSFALDNDVFHVAIQPCHDKKLEANRLDFTGSGLDLVLTTGELLDFMSSKFPEVKDWNAAAFSLVPAESRPFKDPHELMSVLSSRTIDCGRPLYCLPSIGLQSIHVGSEPHVVGSGGYADTVFRRAAQDLFGIEICPVWEPVASTTRRGRNGRGSKRDFYSASLYQSVEDGSYTTTSPSSSSSSNATLVWKFGIAYGLQTVQRIFADIGNYQYVEAMACAGSCLNGAGQLRLGNPETPDETRERLAASRRLFSAASESLDLSIAGAHTRFHMVPAMRHSMGVAAGVAVEDTRW
jgi:iron only hydrogenase large subunit-like protein